MNVPIQPNTCACPGAWIRAGEMLSAVRRPLINTSSRREKRARHRQKLGWRPLRDAARDGEVPDAGILTASFRELHYRRGKQATAARIQDRIRYRPGLAQWFFVISLSYGAGSMHRGSHSGGQNRRLLPRVHAPLVCAVVYDKSEGGLFCSCHQGLFNRTAGPPNRPLPRITVEQRGDYLYAIGLQV